MRTSWHWDCCQPQDPGCCANIYTKGLWLPSSPLCAMNNHATSKSLTREFDFGTKLTWFTVKNNELVTKKQKLLQATQQVLHMCNKEINPNSSEHNPSLESVSVSDSSKRWKKNSVQVTTSKTIIKWEAKRLSANNVQIFQFLLGRIINGWMVRNNIPGFQNEGPDDSTVWKGVFTIALALVIHSYTQPTSMHIFSDSRRVS